MLYWTTGGCESSTDSEDTDSTATSDSTEDTDSTDDETTEDDTDEEVEASEDIMGKVSSVSSDLITMTEYTSDIEAGDYATFDISTLTETSVTRYIYLDSDTEYYIVESENLVEATIDDVTEGAMIAETTSEEDVKQIIILEKGGVDTEEE